MIVSQKLTTPESLSEVTTGRPVRFWLLSRDTFAREWVVPVVLLRSSARAFNLIRDLVKVRFERQEGSAHVASSDIV